MPKQSKAPGRLGDLFRALGIPETAKRLGVSVASISKFAFHPERRPDGFHERVAALYREVCK